MSIEFEVFIEIPKIAGKIEIPNNQELIHIGKREIKNSVVKNLSDPRAFDSISSVRTDKDTGAVIKQQFIISRVKDKYFIEDQNSANGTYLGGINLKQSPPAPLKSGDEIIIPIEENGELIQLKMYFHIEKKKSAPGAQSQQKQIHYPTLDLDEAEYSDPTITPTIPSSANQAVKAGSYQYKSFIYDPNDPINTSNSFIMIQRTQAIPPNAFQPNSGLDLSMVYKLEKSEFWHILVAVGLLFLMIYRYYININLIFLIIGLITDSPGPSLNDFFIQPLPIALIFGISFITHELSHLQTGKHFNFQSRFCLTKVGVKATLKWALIGFPFGLPGAAVSVGVDPVKDEDKMGWIKIAGPFSNFVLGVIFIILAFFIPSGSIIDLKAIFVQASSLNFVLGAFNMIPREVKGFALDGKFIIKWNKPWYFTLLAGLILGFATAIFYSNSVNT
ncbi:site-2 protease family protein [Promethearchaeum syntrophicum]|uniref:Site-2 protease family protein n=1 Tax=Promethearchaeum syntrophicum TaxID=2594042 RepID=A0A5B9D622_9ARCH|nr:site-2 protease family protein [Candidatus Prometheoarchaeum syntrophicum]QEE14544.1 Peptidase family M50 [Candidatus Prometheoarchaeum syntrophicum]